MSIIKKNIKCIIIYNPLSKIGHFDSWCNIFVKVFLENNWTVILVTKNAEIINNNYPEFHNNNKNKLIIFDQNYYFNLNQKKSFIEYFLKKIKIFELLSKLKFNEGRKSQSFYFLMKKIISKVSNYIIQNIEVKFLKFSKYRLIVSPKDPLIFASDIELIVRSLGTNPDIVLNMYLDLYDPEVKVWEKFSQVMKFKWAGIHMDTTHTLTNKAYRKSESLKVIYTLNETDKYKEKECVQSYIYQWIPDITNIKLPSSMSNITKSILKFASGRKIIFLGGSIGFSKNISLWSELCLNLNHNEWYFIQIGKIEYSTLTSADIKGLHTLQKLDSDIIYIFDEYLPDETVFNEIMSISSIIWGLYRDFDRSSNILTKAALLLKPIIVSDRFIMGQRVSKYNTGITSSENNIYILMNAIESLINNPIPEQNYKNYANDFGIDVLSNSLLKSINSSI